MHREVAKKEVNTLVERVVVQKVTHTDVTTLRGLGKWGACRPFLGWRFRLGFRGTGLCTPFEATHCGCSSPEKVLHNRPVLGSEAERQLW